MIPKGWTHDGYNKKTGRPEFSVSHKSSDRISEFLGESPTAKLWSLLWELGYNIDGTLSDLANCAGISRTSLYKILPSFIDNEWIIPSRFVRGVQYYKSNSNHYIVKDMISLLNKFVMDDFEIEVVAEQTRDKIHKKHKKKT